MSLSTVQNANDKINKKQNKPDFHSTKDIDGASCKKWVNLDKNTRNLNLQIDDIKTCQPSKSLNIQRETNKLDDIMGTKPKSTSSVFDTSRRCVNPLNPEYNLKIKTDQVDLSRKFIRNQLDISDIDTKKRHSQKSVALNLLNTQDIPGASPKTGKTQDRSYKDSTFDEKKVQMKGYDPLNPVYKIRDQSNSIIDQGPVEGASSKLKLRHIKDHNALDISDIDGSNSGSYLKTRFKPNPNKNRNAIDIRDIEGATADTRGRLRKNEGVGKNYENLTDGNRTKCQLDQGNYQ